MSEIKVNKLSPRTGTTVTLGDSGDTITVPAGATFDSSSGTLTLPDGSVSLAKLSATGTKDATTFLRGDNTFASAGGDNTPAFQVLLSSAQSIANSTFTKVQLNTELIDTNSAFDNSTNYRFTVPSGEDGNYLFSYGIQFLTFNATRCLAKIEKNGVEIHAAELNDHTSSDNASINASCMLPLVATDYIELFVFQNSGSSNSIRGSATEAFTYLSGFKLV